MNLSNCVSMIVKESTGTKVIRVMDELGNLINKTVIPGVGNKSAKYKAMSTNYVQGKPIQAMLKGKNKYDRTYLYYESYPGRYLINRKNINQRELGVFQSTENVQLTDNTIAIFDDTGYKVCDHKFDVDEVVVSTNYADGAPAQRAFIVGGFARTEEVNFKFDLCRADIYRPGDV